MVWTCPEKGQGIYALKEAEVATSGRRSRRRPEEISLAGLSEENQSIGRDGGGGGFTVETPEEKLKAEEDQRSKPNQNLRA